MKVFHFSGGHSSAYMTLLYYQDGDIVIFCDTGREGPDTYRFVRDFERVNSIPVVWLSGDWRNDVIRKEKCIPNRFKRKCTINMKIKRARRYLRSIGLFSYTQLVGFRFDEPTRVKSYREYWKKVKTEFPLYNDRIIEAEINLYWIGQFYCLKIAAILKNCDLCFQKGEAAVMVIIQNAPEKADKWIEDEESKELNPKGYTYFKGVTMRELKNRALSLSKVYNLEEMTSKFSCTCHA